MSQISGKTPTDPAAQTQQSAPPPADLASAGEPPSGFGSRGRIRRRARFLRKARELAYRDLGGLVFNLHRFGQRNDALVLAKLTTIGHIDAEVRALEAALGQRQPVTVLREAGINACPRCAAIHSSEDRFCPNCGLPMARNVDLPIAGAPAATPTPTPAPQPATPAPAPVAAPPSPAPQPPVPTATPVAAQPVATGRSPLPPREAAAGSPAPFEPTTPPEPSAPPEPAAPQPVAAAGREEITEILKPQGPSS